jgi:hypothetical protein
MKVKKAHVQMRRKLTAILIPRAVALKMEHGRGEAG